MPVLFRNEGATCFFNVAMQMLLSTAAFRDAVKTEFRKRESPMLGLLHHIVTKLEDLPSANAALIASPRNFAGFIPCLRDLHRMQDVFECIDEILEQLSVPGSPRPNNFDSIEAASAAIEAHMSSFSSIFCIVSETHTCMTCSKTTIHFSPLLNVSKVSDTHTISDAVCETCTTRQPRRVSYAIVRPGRAIFVRLSRHDARGQKRHDRICLNEGVTIVGARYSMCCMVYHDGLTFDGGHYTCAFKTLTSGAWVLNSDTTCRFAGSQFDVSHHDAHKTYGAVYSTL